MVLSGLPTFPLNIASIDEFFLSRELPMGLELKDLLVPYKTLGKMSIEKLRTSCSPPSRSVWLLCWAFLPRQPSRWALHALLDL